MKESKSKSNIMSTPDSVGKTSSSKIFTKLHKGSPIPNKSELLQSGYFQKQGKYLKSKRYFELYRNQIYYYSEKDHNQPKGVTEITFDLCFEMISDKIDKKANKNIK